MKYSKFPEVLKQLRKAKGLTQNDLARVLKVSRSTIAAYEARNNQPDFDKLVQIADYFNITIDYLLSGEVKSAQDAAVQIISDKELEKQLIESFHPLAYNTKLHVLDYIRYQKEKQALTAK